MPPDILDQLFGYGVLGVMFVLVMLGILVPKYVLDASVKREADKDRLILELTSAFKQALDDRRTRR